MNKNIKKLEKKRSNALKLILIGIGLMVVSFIASAFVEMLIVFLFVGLALIVLGVINIYRTQKQFKEIILNEYLNEYVEEGHFTTKRKIKSLKRKKPKKNIIKRFIKKTLHITLYVVFVLLKRRKISLIRTKRKREIGGLTPVEVSNAGFVDLGNSFISKDYMEGIIDGVQFKSSDVTTEFVLKGRRNNGGVRSEKKTLFKGRMFVFDFNKPIDGSIMALEKFKPNNNKPYEKYDMESIDFNKTFNVYATQGQLAFYILTPHLMEALMRIEENHPGKIGFSIIKNKLFVALNTGKTTFKMPWFKKIDKTYLESVKKDFQMMYDIIDELKLSKEFQKAQDEAVETDTLTDTPKDPEEAVRDIVALMTITEDAKGKKSIGHTETSQAEQEVYLNTIDKDEAIEFEELLEQEQQKMIGDDPEKSGKLKKAIGCGCGTVLILIVLLIVILVIVAIASS